MNIFEILNRWYTLMCENSDINSNHTSLLFYLLDLNNKLAWKKEFGVPSLQSCEVLNMTRVKQRSKF